MRLSSVMVDMLRLTSSLDDPPAARAALADLRRAAADDAEMRHHIEPFLSLEAVVEMRVLAQTLDEGQEIGPDQQLASVSAALTAMIGMLSRPRRTHCRTDSTPTACRQNSSAHSHRSPPRATSKAR